MAGILSGMKWMMENKSKGLVFGEDLDEEYIIQEVKDYMGVFYSGPVTGNNVHIPGTHLDSILIHDGTKCVDVDDL